MGKLVGQGIEPHIVKSADASPAWADKGLAICSLPDKPPHCYVPILVLRMFTLSPLPLFLVHLPLKAASGGTSRKTQQLLVCAHPPLPSLLRPPWVLFFCTAHAAQGSPTFAQHVPTSPKERFTGLGKTSHLLWETVWTIGSGNEKLKMANCKKQLSSLKAPFLWNPQW